MSLRYRIALAFAAALIACGGAALARQKGPASMSRAGITLTSATLAVPDDPPGFPEGPAGELVTNNCTACHSAEMILNQPPLGAKWQATIEKMRTVYHASIAPADDAALVAALTSLETARDRSEANAPHH